MQSSKKELRSSDHLRSLIAQHTPLLDVRAALEFDQGSLPCSHNVGILNDDERAAVGAAYKNEGAAAATALGHDLVRGTTKTNRLNQWVEFIKSRPGAMVMCWRGGQRSQIAQAWLKQSGLHIERVPGGYKALRNLCLELLDETAATEKPWWIVAGRTGVQKTVLIQQLDTSLDLEALANHRGSAFGAQATAQPMLATFENQLAYQAYNHSKAILVLEDESRTIGKLGMPLRWHERMKRSPLALIEASLESRVEHIVDEYVTRALATGIKPAALEKQYREALSKISRRLGGLLFDKIDQLIAQAFAHTSSHNAWVSSLLNDYYDPMYDYQLRKKESRIAFRGNLSDVEQFLTAQAVLAE